jgi:hypothetical protein
MKGPQTPVVHGEGTAAFLAHTASPSAASRSFLIAQHRAAASTGIRELYRTGRDGESVFVPFGTYAFEPEAFRTIARRAGGSGWCSTHRVADGWRITKGPPHRSNTWVYRDALNYVADMTYCGHDGEWHFKPGYDPQTVLDALAAAGARV